MPDIWISQDAVDQARKYLDGLPVWTPGVSQSEGPDEVTTRLRDALAIQGLTIDQLTGERDALRELASLHENRLAVAQEYIAWLERQLEARLLAEERA